MSNSTPPPETLAGRRILVTGAARRIGRAIALRLHAAGARVLIHYSTSEAEARQTALECGNAPLFQADLACVSEIRRLFAEIEAAVGGLDALVNNAARFFETPLLEATEEQWDQLHAVNLKAVFFCSQQAARLMLRNPEGGRIVNLASMGAYLAWSHHSPYCASKAGVVSLTRTLARALAPTISVNAVAPGVIPFEEAAEPYIAALAASTPAKRSGTGEEIAGAVLHFLEASTFTTGQVLQVDGGMGLR